MRRIFLAAILFGAVHSAHAADFPDLPVLRGALPEGLSSSRVNWQGYYVGGQAEYGAIAARPPSAINSDLQATYIAPPTFSYNWQPLAQAHNTNSGFGGFVGYNSQWDDVVLSAEANYVHSQFRALATSTGYTYFPDLTVATTTNSSALIRLTDFGSLRVRGGYAIGNFLPYLFSGVGVGSTTIDRNISASPASLFTPQLRSSDIRNKIVYGYTVGAGVDVMLIAGLFLRAEYEYKRATATIESNVNSVHAGLGYKF